MGDQEVNFCFRFDGGAFYGFFSDQGLKRLSLVPDGDTISVKIGKTPRPLWDKTLHKLLADYFSPTSLSFQAIPLDLAGGTPFQLKVWEECYKIPYGKTLSYGALAKAIGHPGAARATGSALGANPVSIIIPCHRVISASGRLGGFYYDLSWKERFLSLEEEGSGKAFRR
jgi:methylated-DNA-[protein]-cysteine S-methyltransferase